MDASEILFRETVFFFAALVLLLAVRLLTRRMSLARLLARKDGSGVGVSPERVQLLIATLALSAKLIGGALHSTSGTFPEVSRDWLMVFGGSTGVYAGMKAVTTFRRRV